VAILVQDPWAYIASIFTVVVTLIGERLSPAMRAFWRTRGLPFAAPSSSQASSQYALNLGRYIFDHYGNLFDLLPEQHPLRRVADGNYGDLYTRLLQIAEPHLVSRGQALDLGCNVGGAAFRLSRSFSFAWGLDYSFPAVLWARRILLAQPEGLTTYQLRADGELYHEQTLHFERPNNVEFVVASVDRIPFESDTFDVVVLANMVDVVPDPAGLLDSCHSLLRDRGVLVTTDPYYWDVSIAPSEKWLGGRTDEPSMEGLRKELRKQFCILEERDFAPWILRNSDRYYQLYFCHHIVAQKIIRESSPL
jgi:SAM-dependent methyltransferase